MRATQSVVSGSSAQQTEMHTDDAMPVMVGDAADADLVGDDGGTI